LTDAERAQHLADFCFELTELAYFVLARGTMNRARLHEWVRDTLAQNGIQTTPAPGHHGKIIIPN
jgi:hypothetical protein